MPGGGAAEAVLHVPGDAIQELVELLLHHPELWTRLGINTLWGWLVAVRSSDWGKTTIVAGREVVRRWATRARI